jgi:hypothetical protein
VCLLFQLYLLCTSTRENSGSVRVQHLPEPDPNLLNLNLRSSSKFSEMSGPNLWFGSRFSKFGCDPDRPEPWHHYSALASRMRRT